MSNATQTRRKKTLAPSEIARRAVDEWIGNAATSLWSSARWDQHESEVLERATTEVLEVLKARWIARHGSIEGETDEAINREILGMEAGFLVGVQLGLRLRNVGEVQ